MKTKCNRPIEGVRRMVNETRRWSRRLNPDEGPASQSDREMVNKKIGRWIGRRQYSRDTPDGKHGGGGSIHD
jgi:hypothetical protein